MCIKCGKLVNCELKNVASILNHTLKFKQEVEIKQERIHDLLVSAFEGGCNYWLTIRADDIRKESEKVNGELNVENQIMLGATLHCYDKEEPENKLGEITLVKIIKALIAMSCGEDRKLKKNEHLKTHFNNFITENDDAETADVVIQIAVMGEIVFG